MRRPLEPINELDTLRNRSTAIFAHHIQKYAMAQSRIMRGIGTQKDIDASAYETVKFANIIAGAQGLADLIGRRRLLLESDYTKSRHGRGHRDAPSLILRTAPTGATPIDPDLTFKQAVEDLVSREPRLAKSAAHVAEIYSREHGFSLARTAAINVTEEVRDVLRRAMNEDLQAGQAIQEIQDAKIQETMEPFTRHYSEVIYRTTLVTSYTAGRFQQAMDPDVQEVIAAFEVVGWGDDGVTRDGENSKENHLAIEGLIAPVRHRVWLEWSPGYGYQCRHSVELYDIFDAERDGNLEALRRGEAIYPPNFSAARKHPNFGSRPDLLIYQGNAK